MNQWPHGFRHWPGPPCPLLLVPLLIAATCGPIPQPLPRKDGAARTDPLPVYAAYWYEMEECSGRRRSFRVVRWYIVTSPAPGEGIDCSQETGCDGIYYRDDSAIYLRDWAVGNKQVVKHEILHALGMQHENKDFWRCLGQKMPEKYK